MSDRDPGRHEKDPFDGLTFDEAFVNEARVSEGTASERLERMQRIDAEHRRIVEDARALVREQANRTTPYFPSTPSTPPRRHGRRWALVVVALLLVALFWVRSRESSQSPTAIPSSGESELASPLDHQPAGSAVRLEGGQPQPGRDSQATPIGEPPPLPAATGPFTFVATQPGGSAPVAYDPCRPIHIVINARTAPVGGDTVFREALARVGATTGLQFVLDGSTAEAPRDERSPYQPDRYPNQWAPVLVAWSDAAESSDLNGTIAGQGGSHWLELTDGSVFVSGIVVLDGPDLAEILDAPNGRAVARGIVQHELGHLVGLDHVDDPTQLMYPETSGEVTDFAPGDLRGLAQLGRGRCFPNV